MLNYSTPLWSLGINALPRRPTSIKYFVYTCSVPCAFSTHWRRFACCLGMVRPSWHVYIVQMVCSLDLCFPSFNTQYRGLLFCLKAVWVWYLHKTMKLNLSVLCSWQMCRSIHESPTIPISIVFCMSACLEPFNPCLSLCGFSKLHGHAHKLKLILLGTCLSVATVNCGYSPLHACKYCISPTNCWIWLKSS